MKSKKGGLPFDFLIVIGFTAIMIYAWIELSSKYAGFDRQIGKKQFELIRAYQYGEMALFYLDQSAKYASEESVFDFAFRGGILDTEQKCGAFNGANIWFEIKRTDAGYENFDCFDESKLEQNYISAFNQSLNEYLAENPYGLKPSNYEYTIAGNSITGFAKSPLMINIMKEE